MVVGSSALLGGLILITYHCGKDALFLSFLDQDAIPRGASLKKRTQYLTDAEYARAAEELMNRKCCEHPKGISPLSFHEYIAGLKMYFRLMRLDSWRWRDRFLSVASLRALTQDRTLSILSATEKPLRIVGVFVITHLLLGIGLTLTESLLEAPTWIWQWLIAAPALWTLSMPLFVVVPSFLPNAQDQTRPPKTIKP